MCRPSEASAATEGVTAGRTGMVPPWRLREEAKDKRMGRENFRRGDMGSELDAGD